MGKKLLLKEGQGALLQCFLYVILTTIAEFIQKMEPRYEKSNLQGLKKLCGHAICGLSTFLWPPPKKHLQGHGI